MSKKLQVIYKKVAKSVQHLFKCGMKIYIDISIHELSKALCVTYTVAGAIQVWYPLAR